MLVKIEGNNKRGCADRCQKIVVSVKGIRCDSNLLDCDYEHFIRHF